MKIVAEKLFHCKYKPTQKQTSCKKGAALCKMASMKKVVKYRWRQPRNGCDGRSVTKSLMMTIQVDLCCLIPASLGISTKFMRIVVIKVLSLTYHHSHFWAATTSISQLL